MSCNRALLLAAFVVAALFARLMAFWSLTMWGPEICTKHCEFVARGRRSSWWNMLVYISSQPSSSSEVRLSKWFQHEL